MASVKLALICRGFEFDQQTGEYSLEHIHDVLHVKIIPTSADLAIAIYMDGDVGERFNMSCTILDEKGKIVADRPTNEVTIAGKNHIVFHIFKGVTFSSIGSYAINININGIAVATIPYTVIK